MTVIDEKSKKALTKGLMDAKSTRMLFALVVKGTSNGDALIVSKTKIPLAMIGAAKKEIGGTIVIKGACFGENAKHIFEVATLPAETTGKLVKTLVHNETGLNIIPEFRVGKSPDLQDEDTESEGEEPATSSDGETTDGKPSVSKIESVGGGLSMQAAIKLVAANSQWKQYRNQALENMAKLEAALRATGDEVGEAVADVIEELADNFPRALDATLDQLATAARKGDAATSRQLQAAGQQGIKECLVYLKTNAEKFSACEENEFGVGIKIHEPLGEALRDILTIIK